MIQTDDLFLGAFVLVRGGELKAVDVRGLNGRRVAVFQLEGLDEAEREYHRGAATVDLRLLKTEVRRLKDLAFDAIRKEERRDARNQRRDRANQNGQPARGSRQRARHRG